jgi:hypothetical protein
MIANSRGLIVSKPFPQEGQFAHSNATSCLEYIPCPIAFTSNATIPESLQGVAVYFHERGKHE